MRLSNIKPTLFTTLSAVLMLMAVVLASCTDGINFGGAGAGQAHMDIKLTDAPGDYQEVNIDVQALRIHFTPDSVDTTAGEGKWIDLPVEPMKVNLLDLTNGVDTLLASADLDPGHYRELRLILGPDNSVMVDSTIQNLKVPSGQQSGYKIKFKTDLEAGEELDVTIDFDAGQSVHKAGNSGKYILKPVLKAFVENGDSVEVGSISGTVEPADANASVFAIMDDDTSSTATNDQGEFLIEGLEDGQYDLSIEPGNDQYSDTTLTNITVEEGEETEVGTITLNGNE